MHILYDDSFHHQKGIFSDESSFVVKDFLMIISKVKMTPFITIPSL